MAAQVNPHPLILRDNDHYLTQTDNATNSNGTSQPGEDTNLGMYWNWYAVRWAILLGLIVLILAILALSYLHAQRRMRQGLPLRTYHQWLVPRRVRARYAGGAGHGTVWPMNHYAYGAPPAYNPDTDYVPAYSPPPPGFDNFSKADPSQHQQWTRVREREVGNASSSTNANHHPTD